MSQDYLCDMGKEIEPDEMYLCETGSCHEITLRLTGEQIQSGYHSGNCDADIAALMEVPEIKEQLDAVDNELLDKWWKDDMFVDDTPEEHKAADRKRKLEWLLFDCCANAIDGYCYELR